jgi:AGZA family xanthine/uracil permease-like MFS transporter
MDKVAGALNYLFKLKERGSSVKTEFLAGMTTFFTMSYIIFVQPVILSKCGMDFGAVMVATCLASAIATLLMGILTNYPIAQAPAMGHNFFFVFNVCLAMNIPWQTVLGANFISGVIFIISSLVGFREKIIDMIPDSLKASIAAGIGLLIAFIGFQWSGLIVRNPATFIGLGDLKSIPVLISIFGILFTSFLLSINVRGAILIGMMASTALGLFAGIIKFFGLVSIPPSLSPTFLKLDIADVFHRDLFMIIFVLFFLDLFDSVGTLIGIGEQGGFMKKGKLPKAREVLLSDAIGTVEGTLLGTSTVSSYIESAAGISAGGKTGLSSVFTALFFVISLFFYPIVKMIGGGYLAGNGQLLYPVIAPALIIVGSMMIKNIIRVDWDNMSEAMPAFITFTIMALSVSITDGIAFGFISYSALKLFSGNGKKVHWLIYFFSILFIFRYLYLSKV